MRLAATLFLAVFALGNARVALPQNGKQAMPPLALSCTMESPDAYRNHVVSVTISEHAKSATVQGRTASELVVEYLRFVVVEGKIRWVIDRGTGRVSMFVTGDNAPTLYGTGACQAIKSRKF